MVDKDTKINYDELKKQIEYYMSDKNLKQDEFFNGVLRKSETVPSPILSNFLQEIRPRRPLPQL